MKNENRKSMNNNRIIKQLVSLSSCVLMCCALTLTGCADGEGKKKSETKSETKTEVKGDSVTPGGDSKVKETTASVTTPAPEKVESSSSGVSSMPKVDEIKEESATNGGSFDTKKTKIVKEEKSKSLDDKKDDKKKDDKKKDDKKKDEKKKDDKKKDDKKSGLDDKKKNNN